MNTTRCFLTTTGQPYETYTPPLPRPGADMKHKLLIAAVLALALAVVILVMAAKVDRFSKTDCLKCVPDGLLATFQALATETEKEYRGTPTPTPAPEETSWWKAAPTTPQCLKCGTPRKLWPHHPLTPHVSGQNSL